MRKSNWYLLIFIVVLSIIVYFNNREEKFTEKDSLKTSFIGLDSLKIDRLELKSTDDKQVVLVKDAGKWFISEPIRYPANQSIVEDMLRKISNFEIENIISKNPSTDTTFGVDSVSGFSVSIFENGKSANRVIIGKVSESWSHTYVKESGREETFLLRGNVGYIFKRSLRDWRDKSILKIDKEMVKTIHIQYRDSINLEFKKNDTLWMVQTAQQRARAKNADMAQLLSSLNNFMAADFVDDTTIAGLSAAPMKLDVEMMNGDKYSLNGIPTDSIANRFYVQTSGNSQIFSVYRASMSTFFKGFEGYQQIPAENSDSTSLAPMP